MYNEKGGFLLSVSWEGGLQNEKAACVADSRRVGGGWVCTTGACAHLVLWNLQSVRAVVFLQIPKKTFGFKLDPDLYFGQKSKPDIETKSIHAQQPHPQNTMQGTTSHHTSMDWFCAHFNFVA